MPLAFETHLERHTKSKTGAISGPTKWSLVQQKFFKTTNTTGLLIEDPIINFKWLILVFHVCNIASVLLLMSIQVPYMG